MWTTLKSWSCRRRVVGKAEWTQGDANPRFVVTSLGRDECGARYLYEKLYCAGGDMENRIKECQMDLFADRTSSATMRANQLRLWFASMAYVLVCALRRIGLVHTKFAKASCGTIRLKLLKIGAWVRISARVLSQTWNLREQKRLAELRIAHAARMSNCSAREGRGLKAYLACRLRIMAMISMPPRMVRALSADLNPSMGRTRLLMER